jgi:hypothetical protein
VTLITTRVAFTEIFDRSVTACACAQIVSARCAETALRARETRASARRVRESAANTRAAWVGANEVLAQMRHEVEVVAAAMHRSGIEQAEAAAAVRAHIRFVLYDGGLREQEAEPVVERASDWVRAYYAVA